MAIRKTASDLLDHAYSVLINGTRDFNNAVNAEYYRDYDKSSFESFVLASGIVRTFEDLQETTFSFYTKDTQVTRFLAANLTELPDIKSVKTLTLKTLPQQNPSDEENSDFRDYVQELIDSDG